MSGTGMSLKMNTVLAWLVAKTGLIILASFLSFDLHLAYFSGYDFIVGQSLIITNMARVCMIFLSVFLFVKVIEFLSDWDIRKIVNIILSIAILAGSDIVLLHSLLSEARKESVRTFEQLTNDSMSGSVRFSDLEIQKLWKSESPKNLQFCLIREVPFHRRFIFRIKGENTSYLAFVTISRPVELRIFPLWDVYSDSECINTGVF